MAELKNRKRLGASVAKYNFEDLQKLSEKTRIPASRLLDEAIEDLMKKHKNKEKESQR